MQNLNHTIQYGETIQYDATLTLTFERPCHTYGTFNSYTVSLLGVRDGKEPHELVEETNLTTYTTTSIKPDYNYTVGVSVLTAGDYKSEPIDVTFVSQAGGNVTQKIFEKFN